MLEEFENYLHARRRSPKTIRLRMVYLKQLQDRHPDFRTVTLAQLDNIIGSHPEWKAETINAAISSWRVFYRWANRRHLVDHDPTEFLETVHVPREVKVVASDDAILEAIERADDRTVLFLLLGRECGLRRSEIATLHTTNRDGNWLTVIGKGGRSRRLHIDGRLHAGLLAIEQAQGPGYYFPGRDAGHISPDVVYVTIVREIGTATHSLRRRAITAVYDGSGKDIRLAQAFAGHADPKTTAGYINVKAADLERAGGYASIA